MKIQCVPLRCVIIDDSLVCLKLLGSAISSLGYEVYLFSNGIEALDHLSRVVEYCKFDLIIVDLHMAPINGLDMVSIINNMNLVDVTIGILTTETDPKIGTKALFRTTTY